MTAQYPDRDAFLTALADTIRAAVEDSAATHPIDVANAALSAAEAIRQFVDALYARRLCITNKPPAAGFSGNRTNPAQENQ